MLIHGVRQIAELAYGERITQELPGHEFLGDSVREKLVYYPTVTREAFRNTGRITDLIASEKLFEDLDLPPLDKETDRVMICGGPDMLRDIKALLEGRGFVEGNHGTPGHFVIEKAFVER